MRRVREQYEGGGREETLDLLQEGTPWLQTFREICLEKIRADAEQEAWWC